MGKVKQRGKLRIRAGEGAKGNKKLKGRRTEHPS